MGWDWEGYDFWVEPASTKVEPTFGKCVFLSGIQQVVILVLAGFVEDQGETERSVLWMCGVYWVAIVFVVMRRRERSYTAGDKFFARWGFLAILFGDLAVRGLLSLIH